VEVDAMKSPETVLDPPTQERRHHLPNMEAQVFQPKAQTANYSARRRKRIRNQILKRRRLSLTAKEPVLE
jgi:hypothetical protein